MNFDLAALPSASSVESTALRLVVEKPSGEVFQLSQVLEPWIEGVSDDGDPGCAS